MCEEIDEQMIQRIERVFRTVKVDVQGVSIFPNEEKIGLKSDSPVLLSRRTQTNNHHSTVNILNSLAESKTFQYHST